MEEVRIAKVRVYSLNLAAYLLSKGHSPVTAYDEEENLVIFLFDDTGKLSQDITNYRKNQEIQEFIGSFRLVKKMVASHK